MTVTDKPLDVLIVGAGIAGLSAAIALGKQGHRVVILEKSAFLREAGAAIHLPPNCTALLRWMGIDPLDFGGTLIHEIHRYGYEGDLKFKKEFDDVRHLWQAEFYLVHRVDLHNHLKKRALETATLHTQCKIINVELDGAYPSVTLEDGRIFKADLLLGADGIHSQLRQSIAPGSPSPYAVGKSCFRWLLPTEELRQYENTFDFVKDPGVFIEWSSDDRRLVAYPCSDNKVFNLCAFMPSKETKTDTHRGGCQATGDKATIANAFSMFSPGVRRLIESAEDDLKVWDLYDMKSLPTWTKGHAALLGDAAHPFQPYMGQGAAMAIEDAVCIATLLPQKTAPETIRSRLEMYEISRRARVEFVLHYTRLNGRDENDTSSARMTTEEMVKVMGVCFSHNVIDHSTQLLEGQ
ncbi:hypothetical protein N7522_013495 [Penicillium canescens]|uniref:FAD-binding domain-containing protein n=1 Tax=Penicillium canescens TaxID=5083 RepID=A0AAD6NF22_PENCN|nr:uncharacterized protein N7446_008900 [Penicillium canescens]KAJ5981867.1 hypothetical protein N7522_013495 [Penicillium canescens]KAJ6032807.1 hypothetical protein N7444_010578 [Penicillium canescens]KAJ6058001.1 hypothetical protein N7460_001275 [Penicillium canescens]KAJ6059317.1 hypothetical protein N7446_008900 [Penicillium canescens]